MEAQRLMELCPEQKAKGREKNERVLSLHGTRDPGSSVQVWAPPLEQRVKEAEAVLGGTAEGKAHVTEPWQKPATAVTPAVEGLRTEPRDRQQPAEAPRAPCCGHEVQMVPELNPVWGRIGRLPGRGSPNTVVLKVGPPRNWLEMQTCRPTPKATESEIPGVGPAGF